MAGQRLAIDFNSVQALVEFVEICEGAGFFGDNDVAVYKMDGLDMNASMGGATLANSYIVRGEGDRPEATRVRLVTTLPDSRPITRVVFGGE